MDQSAKKLIAAQASLEYIQDGMVLGVGTGSTVNQLIDLLPGVKNKLDAVVSSSADTKARLEQNGFEVSMLNKVGDVDPRLPVQEEVLGVVTPDGTAVAFPVTLARATLDAGGEVNLAGVRVLTDGGGLRVEAEDGTELVSHQSFWFAWSQFQQDTLVWTPLS